MPAAAGRSSRGPRTSFGSRRLRSQVEAIVVGVGTVLLDDPSLRVHWELLGEPARPEPDAGRPRLDGPDPRARSRPRRFGPDVRRHLGRLRASLPGRGSGRSGTSASNPGRAGPARYSLGELGVRTVLVEGGATVLASVLRVGIVRPIDGLRRPGPDRRPDAPRHGPRPRGRRGRGRRSGSSGSRVGPLGEGVLLTFRPRPRPPT